MLGKNNQAERLRKNSQKHPHYAIKKFKVGVFSVAVAIGLSFLGQPGIVSANEGEAAKPAEAPKTTEVTPTTPESSTPAQSAGEKAKEATPTSEAVQPASENKVNADKEDKSANPVAGQDRGNDTQAKPLPVDKVTLDQAEVPKTAGVVADEFWDNHLKEKDSKVMKKADEALTLPTDAENNKTMKEQLGEDSKGLTSEVPMNTWSIGNGKTNSGWVDKKTNIAINAATYSKERVGGMVEIPFYFKAKDGKKTQTIPMKVFYYVPPYAEKRTTDNKYDLSRDFQGGKDKWHPDDPNNYTLTDEVKNKMIEDFKKKNPNVKFDDVTLTMADDGTLTLKFDPTKLTFKDPKTGEEKALYTNEKEIPESIKEAFTTTVHKHQFVSTFPKWKEKDGVKDLLIFKNPDANESYEIGNNEGGEILIPVANCKGQL